MVYKALVGILLYGAWAADLRAEAPAWAADRYAGLDPAAVVVGLGTSELKPEVAVTTAIAYAYACWDASKTISDRIAKSDKTFIASSAGPRQAAQLSETAEKNLSRSPLCSGLFKDYRAQDGDLMELPIRVSRFADADIRLFVQERRDDESGVLYARVVVPASMAEYARFIQEHGSSDSDILNSLLKGSSPAQTYALQRELKRLKHRLTDDTLALARILSPDFQAWPGGEYRLYLGRAGQDEAYHESLSLADSDSGLRWEEYWPRGRAVLSHGGARTDFRFDEARHSWSPLPPAAAKEKAP
ncbi:MAG: hypothetical protein WC881_03355 [Elusimicrobiota bacterium]|jgi:hypothetical protein